MEKSRTGGNQTSYASYQYRDICISDRVCMCAARALLDCSRGHHHRVLVARVTRRSDPRTLPDDAGRFCKKYLGYEHSEAGYRRIFLTNSRRNFMHHAQRAKKKNRKNFFHHTKSSILKILSKSPRTQIRLLGTPRDFLRSRTTILGG